LGEEIKPEELRKIVKRKEEKIADSCRALRRV